MGDHNRAKAALGQSEQRFQLIVDSIPGLVCTMSPSGEVQLLNRQVLEYFGKTTEELKAWATSDAVHPDDLPRVLTTFAKSIETGQPYDIEHRCRRADGIYRWFQVRALPVRDADGQVTGWYILLTDIEDRKRAEETIRSSEQSLRLIVDNIPGFVWTMTALGEVELVNYQVLQYFRKPLEELKDWTSFVHPDDRARVIEQWSKTIESGEPYKIEHRLRRYDGIYHWFHCAGIPLRNESGSVARWYNLLTDIDERKQAEDALRASETSFQLVVDSIPGLVCTTAADGKIESANRPFLEYFGKPLEQLNLDATTDAIHPDDLPCVYASWWRSVETGEPHEVEQRLRRADGVYRWFQVRALPLRDLGGRIHRWYALFTDIDDRKKTEDRLQRSEQILLEAQRLGHTGSWSLDTASGIVTSSPEELRVFEVGPDEDYSSPDFWFNRMHPDDRTRVRDLFEKCVADRTDYNADFRIVLPSGKIKHQHSVGHPVVNEHGQLVEFLGTTIDTTEHVERRHELERALTEIKLLRDQLQKENVALREEVDRASMFEEIVGSSSSLQEVLSRVVKVAPTDSSVLITGETGTGKELIARAIHKRSLRSQHAFISVNCAALAPALISTELFGHEKGAFTGAQQQRRGRFELAHTGTIFLDEVGELPQETQVALLRVLQERQFERVGGTRAIPADVRLIAATNRDLPSAVVAGTFRADLFYRLNVFPIEVPPLRTRKEDIAMLLEYFVRRFSQKMGKSIRNIEKETFKRCQAYRWPGNVRELQNIVERSMILCSDDTFRIDARWLSIQQEPESSRALPSLLNNQERKIIEAALTASKGKVSGADGAAARLGIPPSTLDSRMKRLRIKKHRFAPEEAPPLTNSREFARFRDGRAAAGPCLQSLANGTRRAPFGSHAVERNDNLT
jgi:PAS domain S-box-containing protein